MDKTQICNRIIGQGEPCFIIAEAGVNHNGNINIAKRLIDAAKEAGADAVKFQTFSAEELVTRNADKAEYQKSNFKVFESQYDMLKSLELDKTAFKELYDYSSKKSIIFLSTPFDQSSVDLLYDIGICAFKIPSGEINNTPLLRYIAQKNKTIILSTGMSTIAEVKYAINTIYECGNRDICLLHCVSNYPAKVEDVNLAVMENLRRILGLPTGFSDHTPGITIAIAAVALGACIIEKHFTLDNNMTGPDHKASIEPRDLKLMVKAIRDVEIAIGDGIKKPKKNEEPIKAIARRSIVAKEDISTGTIISKDMLSIKRPGTGIEPKDIDLVLGKKTIAPLKKDEIIEFSKLSSI